MKVLSVLATALIAAIGSAVCGAISVPVWMMFAGWIAFLAGGGATRTAPITYVCVLLGVLLGIFGAWAIGHFQPDLGVLALPVFVFVIVAAALFAGFLPIFATVIGYFCGMTIFFASSLPPTLASVPVIAIGVAIGVVSGVLASELSARMARGAASETA